MLGTGEERRLCREKEKRRECVSWKQCRCVRYRRREVDEWGEGKETCMC